MTEINCNFNKFIIIYRKEHYNISTCVIRAHVTSLFNLCRGNIPKRKWFIADLHVLMTNVFMDVGKLTASLKHLAIAKKIAIKSNYRPCLEKVLELQVGGECVYGSAFTPPPPPHAYSHMYCAYITHTIAIIAII